MWLIKLLNEMRPQMYGNKSIQRAFRPTLESLSDRIVPSQCFLHPPSVDDAPGHVGVQEEDGAAPFQLCGTATFTFDTSTPGRLTFEASGTAASLGSWTNTGELILQGPPVNGVSATGVAVFTAANGDVLVAEISDGTIIDFATGEAEATFTFVSQTQMSDGTIVESTGRFANVSGSAEMKALGPLAATDFVLDGNIIYSASDKGK